VSPQAPPRWLERLLLWCLPERDRETISGDLLEEYREIQLPRGGPMRANIWYLRQFLGFLAVRSFGGSAMRASLTWLCVGTVLAGAWLAVMENILRHPGYAARSVVAACIVIQGLATMLFLMWQGRPLFRIIVLVAAGGVAVLGVSAVARILNSAHFEGFVLIVGIALVMQGTMALIVVGGARPGTAGGHPS
jgi:hypothetical protein